MALIVVADDDPDIRDLIAIKLEQSGHEVLTAADGVQALAACLESSPDLIVLDHMMPNLDGLGVVAALRSQAKYLTLHDLPVLLLTARAASADVEEGLDAGADEYMTKPFSPRDLASSVSRLLSARDTA